jgi:hypothetical protein
MDDARYTFYEDTADKARTAQSARKFVSKPTERTTAEATSYAEANYKQLTPWKKLKTLPKGMQKEWLERHIAHWNVGTMAIAKAMGIAPATLSKLTNELGIKMERHRNTKAAKLYLEAMGVLKPAPKEPTQEPQQPEPEKAEPKETPKTGMLKTRRQVIEMEGEFNPWLVADAVQALWRNGQPVKIQITIEEA